MSILEGLIKVIVVDMKDMHLNKKLIEKLIRDGFSYYTAKDYVEKQDL